MDAATLELETLLLVRGNASGDALVAPAVDLTLASYGHEADARSEQQVFLSEYLARVAPDVVARFGLPAGVRLQEVDVLLPREDLPRRVQLRSPLAVPCIVIPSGNAAWVVVVPLDYVFYVRPEEDLAAVVRAETQRLVAASQLSSWEFLQLFPARSHALVPLELQVERLERLPRDRAASLRKAMADRERRRLAEELLHAVASPLHAREGSAPELVGRDPERRRLGALLEGRERTGVLLAGDHLAGKSALFLQWIRDARERRPELTVWATSAARLLAGMGGFGQWEERVRRVLEAVETLDAVLYFDNFAELFADRPDGGVDIPGAMKRFLEHGRVRVAGELRADNLDLAERRYAGFLACFARLRVDPLDGSRTAQALHRRIAWEERQEPHKPRLDPAAVPSLVDLAERYLPYQSFPGKAFRLYDDLRAVHERDRTPQGDPAPLGAEAVYEVFSLQTGIPSFLLREDRSLALEEVLAHLRRRMVGQDAAVRRVAETICVVKARLQPEAKPLATFLFVGVTGVGKTELARCLASFLFGAAERMVRFDMSEFGDPEAAGRLIRGTDRSEGLLTRRVREQPFCVLLLDEIEKAHPAVFDLLLQVCGEARLTDALGRTAYFHNAIIIMTSNLGTGTGRSGAGFGAAPAAAEEHYVREVERTFRPEFVNRIDRIVAFDALTPDEVRRVAALALERLRHRRGLTELGIALDVSEQALARIAQDGYSAVYGARALRRHLEDHLVAPVARLLSRLGTDAQPVAVQVTTGEDDPVARPPQGSLVAGTLEASGLRVVAYRARAASARSASWDLDDIGTLRRNLDRALRLPTAVQVKETLEHLVAQLSYGRRSAGDRRDAREVAELQGEHHRLAAVWEQADAARVELHAIEELALVAHFDQEPVEALVADAQAVYGRFRRALAALLVAPERHRDHVTLLLAELDELGALERWLAPLLRSLGDRGWHAVLHVDAGERSARDEWPADRRWGPPRSADWMLDALADPRRDFRCVLLRCDGPLAGVFLSLEAGLHRFSPAGSDGERAHLYVRRIGRVTALSDQDWTHPALVPDAAHVAEERKKTRAARDVYATQPPRIVLGVGRELRMHPEAYFTHFEEVVTEHLMAYEEDEALDRDELFAGPLDPSLRK